MDILQNDQILFDYAGLFHSQSEWIHPERAEKTYEIIYVTEGEVFIEEAGREYHLSRGNLLLLSPGLSHRGTRITSGVGFYWVHFHLKGAALPFTARHFQGFENAYLFRELLHYNNLPQIPTYLVSAILVHILADLCHLSEKALSRYDAKCEKIYEWLRINANATLTVERAAAQLGYSPDHLTRLCKKAYAMGARELINRFVIARAKELLCNTDKYVKEIAGELGFSGDKAFIGFFKYHEGCFPTAFRARFAKTHMNNR